MTDADVISALEGLGYSVRRVDTGFVQLGAGELEQHYVVSGVGVERRHVSEAELGELLETHAERVAAAAALELEQRNEADLRRLLAALNTQTAEHLALLTAPSPTAAQLRAAVVFLLRVTRGLVRLELRDLDELDETLAGEDLTAVYDV